MAATWTRGTPEQLITNLRSRGQAIEEGGLQAVLMSVHEGADMMQSVIINSTTKTGEARSARGGGAPGRIDTGDMFNDVKSTAVKQGNFIVGKFGWIFRPQAYYVKQDDTAFSGKPPMHALLNGYIVAREAAIRRVTALLRTGKAEQ